MNHGGNNQIFSGAARSITFGSLIRNQRQSLLPGIRQTPEGNSGEGTQAQLLSELRRTDSEERTQPDDRNPDACAYDFLLRPYGHLSAAAASEKGADVALLFLARRPGTQTNPECIRETAESRGRRYDCLEHTSELPEDREIPVVMYYPDEQYTGDSVQMDEEILAQEVAKYLKQRGLSSIGAMLAPHDYAKSAAFRKYCGLIPEHTIFSLGDDRVLGEKIFRQYLEMPNPPRIWFFSNYEALQSFVQTAFEQHFPLEQNFEAVCFEDIPCILPLPVYVVNFHAFREKTTEKLIETLLWRLDHPGEASRDVRLPVKLNAGTSMNVPVPASSSAVNGDDLYCNPLPLPDYPEGFFSPSRHGRVDSESDFMGPPRDFRELADPDVICADGVWYVLPSCRQAYVSRDLRNWTYEPIRFADPAEKLGYAPSIVRCGKRFLLTHSVQDFSPAKLFEAESPLGPYRLLGSVTMRDGSAPDPHYLDPAFFCDEDGRLYLYWGIGGAGSGVYGV